jgi:hypothetical protein
MPSTYSPKLKFELIAPGEQPGLWGNTTNKNIGDLIEQAIAGVTTLNLTSISGNVTLSSLDGTVDQARSAVISCEGIAAGPINIIVPTSTKLYVFRNACGQTITIKTAAQVGGYPLVSGESNFVFCNGVSVLPGLVTAGAGTLPVSGGGTGVGGAGFPAAGFLVSPGGTTAFTTQAKISLLGDVNNTLPVSNGGTGVASVASGNLLLGAATGAMTPLAGIATNHVVTWNGSAWTSQAPSAAGVSAVGATAPLASSGGSSPNISLSGIVPLANGGTGASSLAAAGIATTSSLSGYALLASSPTFSGGVTAGGFSTTGTIQANAGFNWTSNTSMAFNSGTSTLQIAIGGQSAATFSVAGGIVSSAALTTGVNPSYFNTQAYLSSNAFGVNGSGIPANAGIYYDAVATGWVISGGVGRLTYVFTNSFSAPGSDNSASSGFSNLRWSQVYAVNGSINTSDVSEKTEIAELDAAEKRVAVRIKGLIKKFKWKDAVTEKGSNGARIHVGVIAQEVKAAFEAEGLDAHRYGMFCYDEWEAQAESVSGNGAVLQEAIPAGARYGVRYEELLAFMIAAL